jgi:hypothetical protein
MAKLTLRRAQVISPFGVGALCEIDGQSFFIRGTASWRGGGNLADVSLPSLVKRLPGVRALKRPEFELPVTRFPRWHFCPACRQMTYWTADMDKREEGKPLPTPRCSKKACKSRQLVPMRFVAMCDLGHLDEIDWHFWVHRSAQKAETGSCDPKAARMSFTVSGKGGGDFSSMLIACSCGAKRSLEGISEGPLPQKCWSKQPGEYSDRKDCAGSPRSGGKPSAWMEPRGSSALHFASVLSALDIAQAGVGGHALKRFLDDSVVQRCIEYARKRLAKGKLDASDLEDEFEEEVRADAGRLGVDVAAAWEAFNDAVLAVGEEEGEEGGDALEAQPQRGILAEEFPVLASEGGFIGRTLVCKAGPAPAAFGLDRLFKKVVQVERLREVRVFRGFQRKDIGKDNPVIPPDLGRGGVNWLPAIEVSGEGIFLEFRQDALLDWKEANYDAIEAFTKSQLVKGEQAGLPAKMGFYPSAELILLHTFAHLLINQLSFDCGYSSTSLKERIYCGPPGDPYAGVLVYTADADSEGSMGGLVEMGGPGRVAEVVYRAVARSRWCSGDPVCRELEEQGVGGLNRAACHACSLVAETSCAFANTMLNRTLVSGTGKANASGAREPLGFFANVLGT